MFQGSIVALITPFTEKGEVDFVSLEKLIQWHREEGTEGLVLCGSTGEGSALSFEEKCAIFRLGVKVAEGDLPIIANTGTCSTAQSLSLTQEAQKIGVEGCIAIVPYYCKPTEEGCLAHFGAIAEVDLPMLIYHHPGRTGVKLSLEALEKICAFPQVIGVKEASGDLDLAANLAQKTWLFSGDDILAKKHLSIGAKGSISIVGNIIPRLWKDYLLQEKQEDPLIEALCHALVLETNPQCVKYATHLLGKSLPNMRLPLLEPKLETKKQIEMALQQVTGLLNDLRN